MPSIKLFFLRALFLFSILFAAISEVHAILWPIANQDSSHAIRVNYGQYQNKGDSTLYHYFHSALDFPANSGDIVFSVENGFIEIISDVWVPGGHQNYIVISTSGSPNEGWQFHHVDNILLNPRTTKPWVENDSIGEREALCEIVDLDDRDHLHFADVESPDKGWSSFWVDGNPLEALIPNSDTLNPTVGNEFHFHDQSSYVSKTGGRYYLKENIDIIAEAHDHIFDITNQVAPYRVRFKLDEIEGNHDIPFQDLVTFTGMFAINIGYGYDDALIIYANDDTCNSENEGDLYFIVTNQDNESTVSADDSSRYWDTDGKEGDPWNDIDEGVDHEATSNADAAFPDSRYNVTVSVNDLEQNFAEKTVEVFVNNFDEAIETGDAGGNVKDVFIVGTPVYIKGSGFPANRQFTAYVVKNTDWTDGIDIPSGSERISTTVITTTDSGTIEPIQLWDSYALNGKPDQGYDVIIDYDGDEKYTSPKEGFTVDALDDDDVGGAGFTSLGIDISLVLDRSGSMAGAKLLQEKIASGQLVSMMNYGDNVAVTSFANVASVDFSLANIVSDQTKIDAQNEINNISANYATSIGAGMQTGQVQLDANAYPNYPQAMILLSDGLENCAPKAKDILPTIPIGTDIYTIGLGSGADAILLSWIAFMTGGYYSFSPSPAGLSFIFNMILQKVINRQQIDSHPGFVSGGSKEEVTHDVLVDASIEGATFALLWQDSVNVLDLVLMTPDSTKIDSTYAATDPNISFSSFPAIKFYTIAIPDSGQWTAKVIGVAVADSEEYVVSISGYSDLQQDIDFNKSNYFVQDTVIVTATLTEDGNPFLGATVEAEIEAPSSKASKILHIIYEQMRKADIGEDFTPDIEDQLKDNVDKESKTDYLTLYDDGNHSDGAANDGVYGNFYENTATIGNYSFAIAASGSSISAGPFMRQSFQSIFISNPPEIEFSTTIIDFGDVIVNTSSTSSLIIYNIGSGAAAYLDVNDIQSTNPVFQPDTTEFFIRAGLEDSLLIDFSPSSVDSFEALLEMQSNDPDEGDIQLTLKGNGIPPPDIEVTPDSFSDSLFTGQNTNQYLTIFNVGESKLCFDITTEGADEKSKAMRMNPFAEERGVRRIKANKSDTRTSRDMDFGSYRNEHRARSDGGKFPLDTSNQGKEGSKGAGNVLGTYENFPNSNTEMVWVNDSLYVVGNADEVFYRYDISSQQVVDTVDICTNPRGIAWDGEHLWIGDYFGDIHAYDLDGNHVDSIDNPLNDFIDHTLTWDGQCFVINKYYTWDPTFYRVDSTGSVVDSFTSSFGGYADATIWVPEHLDGSLWVNDRADVTARIVQLSLADGVADLVSEFEFSYYNDVPYSLAHDGIDLWGSDWNGPLYQIDDGTPEWLSINPRMGTIQADSTIDIGITFDATDLNAGDYYADIVINSNDPDESEVTIPAHLHVHVTPEAIDDLTIKLAGDALHLEWTEPYDDIGVTRYVVYRNTAAYSLGDSLTGTTDTTYTDMGVVGDVDTNYFYMVKAVDGVGNKSEESNEVGEFDVYLSYAKSKRPDGFNYVSWPFIVSDTHPQAVFADSMGQGCQLTGGKRLSKSDYITYWDGNEFLTAWYELTATPPIWRFEGSYELRVEPDKGYKIVIRQDHPAVTLTMTGVLSDTNRIIPISPSPSLNWVGSCFAVPCSISGPSGDDAGLLTSNFTGAKRLIDSDNLDYFDDPTFYTAWYKDYQTTQEWKFEGDLSKSSVLMPGRGYILTVKEGHAFTNDQWIYEPPPDYSKGGKAMFSSKPRGVPVKKAVSKASKRARRVTHASTTESLSADKTVKARRTR